MSGGGAPDAFDSSGLDPTGRFTDRARDYARHRPGYPPAAIDAVLEGLGPASSLVAVDVGAGTGISARCLADRGVRVLAVEPNRAMREEATPHPLVEWRDGTAEATGCPAVCADLVLCAQAYHWFRPAEALAEFRRVLRPGGRVALVWNERDPADPVTAAYGRIVEDAGPKDILRVPPIGFGPMPTGWSPPRAIDLEGEIQALDLDGLLGRAMSASYVPRSGPTHDAVDRALRSLHAAHAGPDGRVRFRYRVRVFLSEPTGA